MPFDLVPVFEHMVTPKVYCDVSRNPPDGVYLISVGRWDGVSALIGIKREHAIELCRALASDLGI